MRLKHIKLSGFKSFLEPVTFSFDTPLTGIVGPNGCGKSNIVDAIRWVIGESSAKQLRGEQLSDVIFGGSAGRKPVGKAQVELVFDNGAGQLGGRFAAYHEVSIQREITREGGSTYLLNQSPCRRRDIVDVLLGTGLGARNYAVIEQGMISHLISATPEVLRGYLEEAAMVSKYKERRKEAESRILRTRENINRINDLLLEVEEQLEKVKRQAEAARTYKEWKHALQSISAQLEALEILKLQKKCKQGELAIQEKEQLLAQHLQSDQQLEQEQTALHQQHHQQVDAMSREQEVYYSFSVEISRLEQALKDARHQQQRLQDNIRQFEHNRIHLKHQRDQDQAQQGSLQSQHAQDAPLLAIKTAQFSASQQSVSEKQNAWQTWQQQWDHCHQAVLQTHQSMEIKKNQLHQLQRLMDALKNQHARLQQEKIADQDASLLQDMCQWEAELSQLIAQMEEGALQLQTLEQAIHAKQQQQFDLEAKAHQQKNTLQALNAEHASLKSLQKLALEGKKGRQAGLIAWLKQQGHPEATHFAKTIQVTSGWEKAVESVLSDALDALCVENIHFLASSIALEEGLYLVESGKVLKVKHEIHENDKLIYKLKNSNDLLKEWLSPIYTAETLEEALAQRLNLKPHESVITPEGIWLGKFWLKMPPVQDERSGTLARQHRLETLDQAIIQEKKTLSDYEGQQQTVLTQFAALKKTFELAQQEHQRRLEQKMHVQANLNAKKTYLQQMKVRSAHAQEEIAKLEKEMGQHQQEYTDIQNSLDALTLTYHAHQQTEQQLQVQKHDVQEAFETEKTQLSQHEQALNQLKSSMESNQKQLQYLEQQCLRTQEQIAGIDQQLEWFQTQLWEIEASLPRQEADWTSCIEKRQASETHLKNLKAEHQATEQSLQHLKQRQQEKKSSIDAFRKTLERLRIDQEAQTIQLLHHQTSISKLGLDWEMVVQTLPKEANQARWLEQQDQLHKNIQNLGEINLAATQEYEELLKRKTYLEAQSQDLSEGLATLEAAIRKMDQETCLQLKNTFEQVNMNFMTLFSKIFEGGQASLELTENDWLTTGIVVKAQPKGKRNTTIQLLSGGEKALTAIALIFALFQLNPAPFCILDEVDAPLDDHNIGRFCKLVEEMSHTLQFIFISHSKVTLTMARQLIGVTMRDAGVSSVVSVNMEEAIRMAEA